MGMEIERESQHSSGVLKTPAVKFGQPQLSLSNSSASTLEKNLSESRELSPEQLHLKPQRFIFGVGRTAL